MQIMTDRLTIPEGRQLADRIGDLSGQTIVSCYQCGECTAGCPVAYTADLMPNQVIRMVQLGQDSVLESSMIWLCVGCETCATRCPRSVELSKVMDALRETAVARKSRIREPAILTFHKTFLKSVERMGRTHEVSMLAEYKLRSRDLFSDIFLGIRMFLKGKLALVPKFIKGKNEVSRIIRNE
jgi:heterodisulfide reductase subunit C